LQELDKNQDTKRKEALINSMIPQELTKIVKENTDKHTKISLAKTFSSASILFCGISDFSAITERCTPLELIELLHMIFSVFDEMVDRENVYKVEAIDNTYLVSSGCPNKDPNHAYHLASMAMMMMFCVHGRSFTLKSGTVITISLKIGMHAGPVVGGVVGKKSYSYHFFGDTVNTSSRMYSSGCDGKIQMSDDFKQLLTENDLEKLADKKLFSSVTTAERGLIQVKGKGKQKTHWLLNSLSATLEAVEAETKQRRSPIASFISFKAYQLKSREINYARRNGLQQVDESQNSFASALNLLSCDLFTLQFVYIPPEVPNEDSITDHHKSKLPVAYNNGRRSSWDEALDKAGIRSSMKYPERQPSLPSVPGQMLATNNVSQAVGLAVQSAFDSLKLITPVTKLSGTQPVEEDEFEGSDSSSDDEESHKSGASSSGRDAGTAKKTSRRSSMKNSLFANKDLKLASDELDNALMTDPHGLSKSMEARFGKLYNTANLHHLQSLFFVLCVFSWVLPFALFFMKFPGFIAAVPFFAAPVVCSAFYLFLMYSASNIDYLQFCSAAIFITLTILVGIYNVSATYENEILSNAFEFHVMIVAFSNIVMRLKVQHMYSFNACVIVIYALTLYIPFVFFSDTFHEAPPDDLIGFLFVLSLACLVCMRMNYYRESFQRKDFVLNNMLKYENVVTKSILTNMFPKPSHAQLLLDQKVPLEILSNAVLLYSDIKGFTKMVETMDPLELFGHLDNLYSLFDSHLEKYGIYKLDTIGDAFVCIIGAGEAKETEESDATRMIKFAFHMLEDINSFKKKHNLDLDMRIGVHKGDVVGAVVGSKKPRYLCWGKDCIVGNKLESSGEIGKVHISEAVRDELMVTAAPERFHWDIEKKGEMSVTFNSKLAPSTSFSEKGYSDDGEDEQIDTYFVTKQEHRARKLSSSKSMRSSKNRGGSFKGGAGSALGQRILRKSGRSMRGETSPSAEFQGNFVDK
jgi:class 3 adenylate cyclase